MKLPSTVRDKLCAALSLGLVCGLALPLESVQAKSKKAKSNQAKPSAEKAKAKSVGGDEQSSAKPAGANDSAPEAKQTPKKTEDLCPACGRG